MKKALILVCSLFAALLFTSCFEKESSSSKTVIKSADGSQKVDLVGTWVCKDGYTFKMIFGSDGSFTYGCGGGKSGGPAKLYVDGSGNVASEKEFNQWWYKGTYKTAGNVLIMTVEQMKNFSGSSSMRTGESTNFVVSIVNNDELVIQTSRTTRTYRRQ